MNVGMSARRNSCNRGGGRVYLLPFISIPSPVAPFFSSPPLSFPLALSTLPFLLCSEADPLNTARGLGSAVSSPVRSHIL